MGVSIAFSSVHMDYMVRVVVMVMVRVIANVKVGGSIAFLSVHMDFMVAVGVSVGFL